MLRRILRRITRWARGYRPLTHVPGATLAERLAYVHGTLSVDPGSALR